MKLNGNEVKMFSVVIQPTRWVDLKLPAATHLTLSVDLKLSAATYLTWLADLKLPAATHLTWSVDLNLPAAAFSPFGKKKDLTGFKNLLGLALNIMRESSFTPYLR
jgi:hypothetical protein